MRELKKSRGIYKGETKNGVFHFLWFFLFVFFIVGLSGYFYFQDSFGSFITGAYAVNVNKLVSSSAVLEVDGIASSVPLSLVKIGEDWYYNITTLDLNLSVGEHVVKIIDNSIVVFEENISVFGDNFSVEGNFDVQGASDYPQLNFTSPTLANNTRTTNTLFIANVSINTTNALSTFIWNWNGTNYTIYNNSLLLMYNFDNISSLGENATYIVDMSNYSNNATIIGSSNWTSAGKYGGAYVFNTSTYMTISNVNDLPYNITPRTISLWFKTESLPGFRTIFSYGASSAGKSFGIFTSNQGADRFNAYFSGYSSGEFTGIINMTLGDWHNIIFTYNGTYLITYSDGVQDIYQPYTANTTKSAAYIGTWTNLGSGYNLNGTIDEFRIWNRSLSADEVYEQYASNLQKFNSTLWYFYINQGLNATAGLALGNYTYYSSATDSLGNSNQTEIRQIIVFDSAPALSFIMPTLASGTASTNNFIQALIEVNDTNYKNYSYYLYNSTGLVTNITYFSGDLGVSLGEDYTCVLLTNGNISCYGGDNDFNQRQNYTLGNAISVSVGSYHNCALLNNGNISCWGYKGSGEGDGRTNNYTLGNAVGVSAGYQHTCALLNNGNVSCWGNNEGGRTNNYSLGNAVGVSAGYQHTCALLNNRNVSCWGDNIYGQRNNYSLGNAVGVSAGGYHTCALLNNRNVSCWGDNTYEQRNNYTQGNAVGVSAGYQHTCALLNNGNVSCWGTNNDGRANNYSQGNAVGVSAGYQHTCALLNNGNVSCWGTNNDGRANNYTFGNAKKQSLYTFMSLANGNYYLNATACDTLNQCNSTETRTFYIYNSLITGCNNITLPGSYVLMNEVQSGGTCINISSSNVILDCQGYKINYSDGGNAIEIGFINNITLKNCVLNKSIGSGDGFYGVNGIGINNLTITNFTIYSFGNDDRGMNFENVNFSYIDNSTFVNTNTDATFITATNIRFLVVNNVNIFSGLGISLNGVFNNITNSRINITHDAGNYAILMLNGVNNSILNNVIYSNATGVNCPISFSSTNNRGNIFSNNKVSCPNCNAVCNYQVGFFGSGNIFNSNIISNSLLGFSFTNSANWTLFNNSIYNVTRGIYLLNITNITIDGGNISSTSYSFEVRNSTSVNVSNIYLSRLMFFNNTNATLRNFYLVNNSADASSFSKGYYIYYSNISFNNSVNINTTNNIFVQPNLLGVVSENLGVFNTTANLSLFAGTGYATVSIQKNGVGCSSTYCMNVSYNTTTGYVTFIVNSFSNYSATGSGSSTPAAAATASPASSSGGGAASGTSAGATASASNMWASVVAGIAYTYDVGKSDISISSVTFIPTEALSNVKIAVKEYGAKPAAAATAPEGSVFKYNEISATILTNEQIQSASIKFVVDKSWVDTKGAKESIGLFRYNNGVWEKLTTTYVGLAGDKYQYEAVTPGFSYFAISYTGAVQTNTNEPAPAVKPETTDSAAKPKQSVSEVPAAPEKSSSSEDFISKNSTLIFVGMGVGFVILFVIIISIVITKKKKDREEEKEEETKAIAKKAEAIENSKNFRGTEDLKSSSEAKQKAEEDKAAVKKAEEAKAEAVKTEVKSETPKEEPKQETIANNDDARKSKDDFRQVQQVELEEEHLNQMYSYMEECVKNNISLEEAKMNLINQGWIKKEVERAAGIVIIQDYIQKSIKSGFDKTTINNALLKKGWPAKLIDEAYKKM